MYSQEMRQQRARQSAQAAGQSHNGDNAAEQAMSGFQLMVQGPQAARPATAGAPQTEQSEADAKARAAQTVQPKMPALSKYMESAFSEQDAALLFATHSMPASERMALFSDIRKQREKLTKSLEDLASDPTARPFMLAIEACWAKCGNELTVMRETFPKIVADPKAFKLLAEIMPFTAAAGTPATPAAEQTAPADKQA